MRGPVWSLSGVVWCSVVWCGVVWCGVVWCCVLRCCVVRWGGVGLVKVCIFHNQKMHFYLIFWLSLWPAINLGNAKNQTRDSWVRSINATSVLRHPFAYFVLYLECVSKRRLSHFLNSRPLSSQGGLWGLRKNKRPPNW